MKKRHGVSLIELTVIMSACTVGLSLTGVLVQRAMKIQMLSRAHVDAERTSIRLSKQFREDVHQAQAVITAQADLDKNVFLRLVFANGETAEYLREGGRVLRVGSHADGKTSREEFKFLALDDVTIETTQEPRRLVLTVVAKPIEQPADAKKHVSTRVVPVNIRAEAVVGSALRFGGVPENQEAPE